MIDTLQALLMKNIRKHPRLFALVGPLAIVIIVITLLSVATSPPQQVASRESQTTVRYVTAERTDVIPRAIGYGFVKPEKVWNGIMQVAGEVVYRNPDLHVGSILPAGTELIRIDPTDYTLSITRLEANVAATEARLAELNAKEDNIKASLAIEERALELKQNDLERKKSLFKRGNISQAAVDQEERALLNQSQSVQSQRNQLNLMPTQRKAMDAELALANAQLNQARIDLERTSLKLPFDARIAAVNIEETQVVSVGQVAIIADSLARAEVDAQIPLDKFVEILPAENDNGISMDALFSQGDGTTPAVMDAGLHAIIHLKTGNFAAEWPAKVLRLTDQVDPQTRTVGVVVGVDDPYAISAGPRKPPLAKNMYVEVELRGKPRKNVLLVPRAAIHEKRLYVIKDNRLDIRDADIAFIQGNIAVLNGGLEPGEQVVVSDLIPAIPGMLLNPLLDEDASAVMKSRALGEASAS